MFSLRALVLIHSSLSFVPICVLFVLVSPWCDLPSIPCVSLGPVQLSLPLLVTSQCLYCLSSFVCSICFLFYFDSPLSHFRCLIVPDLSLLCSHLSLLSLNTLMYIYCVSSPLFLAGTSLYLPPFSRSMLLVFSFPHFIH